jgi:SagB-type dehydrogenase family enzyme
MRIAAPDDAGVDRADATYGSLDEQYHVATRSNSFTKRCFKAHETHYSPWVQQLVADAPLHHDEVARIALPEPAIASLQMPIGEALVRRRSRRLYGLEPLPASHLSTLLASAVGVRRAENTAERVTYHRSVTNSGNLGSVEAYPIVLSVNGVPPGVYHFDSVRHDLAQLRSGIFREWLRERVLFQLEFADASAAVVLTSAFGRLKSKYGPRGYRLGLLDIGHVSQNVYLTATALGLAVCATAGFVDEELEAVLELDGLETAASLVMLVGPPAPL